VNITVSGLTGAGKTTYSRALADHLGLEYISGATVRADLMGLDAGTSPGERRDFWLHDKRALAADAQRLRPDRGEREVEDALTYRHDRDDGLTFDVWFMPWLARRSSIRIWLDAPFETRLRRVAEQSGRRDLDRVRVEVAAKDERSRAYALKQYNVDIYEDRTPFTLIARVVDDLGVEEITAVLLRAIAGVVAPGSEHDRVLSRSPSTDNPPP
jgi:cytidylate kinase